MSEMSSSVALGYLSAKRENRSGSQVWATVSITPMRSMPEKASVCPIAATMRACSSSMRSA